ncbi:MAG: hypothetical protein WC603_01515 [Candidatus Paceibacterota bacterium]|jgi:hypothetical protein
MEENKNCCENKEKGCCDNSSMHGCCHLKKCHGMKYLIVIVLLIVAFCLGTQWGEMRSYTKNYSFGRGMMNWNYKNVKPLTGDEIPNTPAPSTGTVTQ